MRLLTKLLKRESKADDFSAVLAYTKMSDGELNASYAELKNWLYENYEEQINAALMMRNYDARFPVELNDGMYYEVDIDYNLICYGFKYKELDTLPEFEKLTIIADIIENSVTSGINEYKFGKVTNLYAPFCTKIISKWGLQMVFDVNTLRTISMPVLKVIPEALLFGLKLDSVNFPNVEVVKENAFSRTELNTLSLPKVDIIESSAFTHARISSISIPNCRDIGGYAFLNCEGLCNIEMPTSVYIDMPSGDATSRDVNIDATAFTSINCELSESERQTLVSLTILDDIMLPRPIQNWGIVRELNFPNCKYIHEGDIKGFDNLEVVSFPACEYIEDNAVKDCPNLKEIYIPERVANNEWIQYLIRSQKVVVHLT